MATLHDDADDGIDEMYEDWKGAATYYPMSGSTPSSVDLFILVDEQEGSNDNSFENSAETAKIWIKKADLVIIRTRNTSNPVPENETIYFRGETWRVKEILKNIKYEWQLEVEKEKR